MFVAFAMLYCEWLKAQQGNSSPGRLSKSIPVCVKAMSKRLAMMCVAKVAKKVRKAAVDEAVATLEKASQSAPEMSDVAKGIVESTGGGKSGSKPEDVAPKKEVWDLNYRSFGRFPRSLMQKMLLEQSEGGSLLSAQMILFWKETDKDIVLHLFEFDYHFDLRSQWPAGECHVKGVPEQVLAQWQKKNGGSQIAKAGLALVTAGGSTQPDWGRHGVFWYRPEVGDIKTHVYHRPTGHGVLIPASLGVDSTWTFAKNWSAKEALAVDSEGYGRKVSSFFAQELLPSEVDWVDFAVTKAKRLCPDFFAEGKAPTAQSVARNVSSKINLAALLGEMDDYDSMARRPLSGPTTPDSKKKPAADESFTPEAMAQPPKSMP
jgi:hypothetical protein